MTVDSSEKGKEPGGWELLRGMNEIKDQLKSMSNGFLSASIFEIEKRAIDEKFEAHGREIKEREIENRELRQDVEQSQQREQDARNRARAMWISIIVGPIIAAVITLYLAHGFYLPPS